MKKIHGFLFTRIAGTKYLQSSLLSRHYSGSTLLAPGRITHKFVSWSPSSFESIKVNFVAAVLTNKAIIGYVIRNINGDLILAMASGEAISLHPVNHAEIVTT